MVYINDVSCDKCRGSQYRSARITGEFIALQILLYTTIESIFQNAKIFCPFSKFLRKGTKRDMKDFIIPQICWYFISLFVPFCPFSNCFLSFFCHYKCFYAHFAPIVPFSPVPFCLLLVMGDKKGCETPPPIRRHAPM